MINGMKATYSTRRGGAMFRVVLMMLILMSVSASLPMYAATPAETLQKCVAKLKGAKSMRCDFTMTSQGQTLNGTLLTQGKKFSVTAPGHGTWYDGTQICSYTASTGEATIWIPAASELAESNPLLYLSAAADYNVSAGEKAKGVVNLTLTPKKRGSSVKSIRLTLNASTLLPARMVVMASTGPITITVKNLKLGAQLSNATFAFPRAKYPGVKVTDLR